MSSARSSRNVPRNLQVEANQVLRQVGEAKAILAEAKLEIIENQGIMTNPKAINPALETKAAEVVQQVAEARALATEAKLEVTEVPGIRSQIEASITPRPPPPHPPAPVNDHLAEIKTIKAKYEAELTEATRSAQVGAGEASTAARAASRDAAIAANLSNVVKETALRMNDYVEEAKRYNAQSYSNVCDTRRHPDQVEATVEKVVPFAHEPLAHQKETGDKGKEQDSTWKSEAPGIRFTGHRPEPINEENPAKEEIAEALEAARNITRLYNETAETADNRTEAIQKPASTGNVSPFSFYPSKAGHINRPGGNTGALHGKHARGTCAAGGQRAHPLPRVETGPLHRRRLVPQTAPSARPR